MPQWILFSTTAASISRKWPGLRESAPGTDWWGTVRLGERNLSFVGADVVQEERAVEFCGICSEKPPPFALVNRDGDQSTHSWFELVGTRSIRAEPHLKPGLWVWQRLGRKKSEFTALQTVAIIHVTENAKHLVIPGNS